MRLLGDSKFGDVSKIGNVAALGRRKIGLRPVTVRAHPLLSTTHRFLHAPSAADECSTRAERATRTNLVTPAHWPSLGFRRFAAASPGIVLILISGFCPPLNLD